MILKQECLDYKPDLCIDIIPKQLNSDFDANIDEYKNCRPKC